MSSDELWIVIILGLVGYWGTSILIKFFKKESDWTKNQNKSTDQNQSKTESPKTDNNKELTWYEILGVSPTASLDEIKSSYKKKISMYHPDKVNSMGPEFNEIAQQKTKEINSAYDKAMKLKK